MTGTAARSARPLNIFLNIFPNCLYFNIIAKIFSSVYNFYFNT